MCPLYRDSVVLPKRSAKKTLAEISFHKTCTGFGWANKQGTLLLFRRVRKYFLKHHRGRSDFGVNTCYLQVFWKMKYLVLREKVWLGTWHREGERQTDRQRDRERQRESDRRVGFKNSKVCLYQRSIESKVELKELG